MDRWGTKHIPLTGGLRLDVPRIAQGINHPGSLRISKNFEPAIKGGYRRLTGSTKYDTTVVPGTGEVLGTFVFFGGVVAMRGTAVYFGSGSGWTAINGADTRTAATKYRAYKYNWSGNTLVFVDGVNDPVKYNGTTYTVLTNAPAGAADVVEHKNHLWFSQGSNLTFSAPNDDTLYSPVDGGGIINVGTDITGIRAWRGELYVFSRDRIQKLTGVSKSTFSLVPVTNKLGCVNGDTIQEIGGDLLFLGPDGVRTIAGTSSIGDIELGSLSEAIKPLVNNLMGDYGNGSISSVVVRAKGQYRLFASNTGDAVATAFGVIGGVVKRIDEDLKWEWGEIQGMKVSCVDSGYINSIEYVIHGTWDGFVHRQEFGDSFDGADVVAVFALPYITFEDPNIRAIMQKLEAFIDAEGLNKVAITLVFDYDGQDIIQPPEISVISATAGFALYDDPTVVYDTGGDTYGSTPETQSKFNLEGSCVNVSIIFSSNDSLAPYTVKELLIQYGLGGRR